MSILPPGNSARIGFTNIPLIKRASDSIVLKIRILNFVCLGLFELD